MNYALPHPQTPPLGGVSHQHPLPLALTPPLLPPPPVPTTSFPVPMVQVLGGSVGTAAYPVPCLPSLPHQSPTPPTVGGGRPETQWSPISQQVIEDSCKAQKEFGRESEFFQGLLKATLSSAEYVPADLRTLFSCLIIQAVFLVWESTWKREIRALLPDLWANQDTSIDIDGTIITVDHLCGVGDWDSGPKQADNIPQEALKLSTKAAEKAFFKLKPSDPVINYLCIKQEPFESFVRLIDRLHRAVDLQVPYEGLRRGIITEIAKQNANEACKNVILSLPLDPEPMLQNMLEVCARKVITPTRDHQEPLPPPNRTVSIAEATLLHSTRRFPGLPRGPQKDPSCHLCQQKGHWAQQCPMRDDFLKFKNQQQGRGISHQGGNKKT